MSTKITVHQLKEWGCFSKEDGRLVIYPSCLTYDRLIELTRSGKLVRKNFGSATYGAGEFYLADFVKPGDFAILTKTRKAQGQPPFIVHNTTEKQIRADFRRHYPGSQIASIKPVQFNPETGNYDERIINQ